jgi:head-tail adaptor
MLLGVEQIDAETASSTANILLKYQTDIAKAVREYAADKQGFKQFAPGPK